MIFGGLHVVLRKNFSGIPHLYHASTILIKWHILSVSINTKLFDILKIFMTIIKTLKMEKVPLPV